MAGVLVDLLDRLPLRARGPVAPRPDHSPRLICPLCRSADYTILRHHYLGRVTQWWCLHCHEAVPPVAAVR